MKILPILKGWYNFIHATPEIKSLMQERLTICDSCTHKITVDGIGRVVNQFISTDAISYKCEKCQCFLSASTANPDYHCPLHKW